MKIKGWSINITPPRKEEELDKKIGIIKNGEDNAYPTMMERFVNNSITAKTCANMYARFLVGKGFEGEQNKIIVGYDKELNQPITAHSLLRRIAREYSKHSGTFINIQRNANLKITGLKTIPSKQCRFGKEDSNEYSGKICVYNNWDKSQSKKIEEKNIEVFNVYNKNPKSIKYQITGSENPTESELIEGIQKWKGQIYFQFLDDEFIYPLSPIDVVQHDADTELQISLFKNGELRRGFFMKYIMSYAEFEDDSERQKFEQDMRSFEGANEGGSILMVEGMEYNRDTGNPIPPFHLQKVEQNINDKIFESYEVSIANNIRKSYNNIPPVLIDYQEGKLSTTSGESIIQAINFYNTQTESDRESIEEIFNELMSEWHQEEYSNLNWTIKTLESGATNIIQ